jgi:pimeloyl-ACP methyl ester carboxylesterase
VKHERSSNSADRRQISSSICRPAGFKAVEHQFRLPLDYAKPSGPLIEVFAREVAAPDGDDRPFLVFFEGGPGHEDPRPLSWESASWIKRALKDFRVLFLDQRGTGRSSPIDAGALAHLSGLEQADYLKLFRADSIVRDAEQIREALGIQRWTVLGVSFGGFCVLNYLSFAPDGLDGALISGGLPSVRHSIDDVYQATYRRVLEKVERFYDRYPSDVARVRQIHKWLDANEVRLPTGDRLTPRRFRQLGWLLGLGDGLERLHYLLELPVDSSAFLFDVERALPFARNPLYAVIHEACWANGGASRWSASRLLNYEDPTLFTGEHVYPWMFEDYGVLAPLREAAELLAQYEWERLYDEDQLRVNNVPTAAVIYSDDMYVESTFSLETAAIVRGLRPWLTNEYEHDGLETSGTRVLRRLLDLARGRA